MFGIVWKYRYLSWGEWTPKKWVQSSMKVYGGHFDPVTKAIMMLPWRHNIETMGMTSFLGPWNLIFEVQWPWPENHEVGPWICSYNTFGSKCIGPQKVGSVDPTFGPCSAWTLNLLIQLGPGVPTKRLPPVLPYDLMSPYDPPQLSPIG